MNQRSFSDIEYGLRKRTTKREEFLKAMGDFIPWDVMGFAHYTVLSER